MGLPAGSSRGAPSSRITAGAPAPQTLNPSAPRRKLGVSSVTPPLFTHSLRGGMSHPENNSRAVRKPVGAYVYTIPNGNSMGAMAHERVVCDDGSVWRLGSPGHSDGPGWHEMEPIPGTPRAVETARRHRAENPDPLDEITTQVRQRGQQDRNR